MKNLKFSIVTPSYNQGLYIERNIFSVLKQNYNDFEHIIFDGGSSDDTIEILKKYPHLIWVSERDSGQSHAVNKGIKMATGDIICWINSDDELEDNALHIADDFFQSNPHEFALTGSEININRKNNFLSESPSRKYFHYGLLNINKDINQPSTFFKKEVFIRYGFLREDLHYAMDYEFFLRVTKYMDIPNISYPLAKSRRHDATKTSSNIRMMLKEQKKVRKEYKGELFCRAAMILIWFSLKERLYGLIGDHYYNSLRSIKHLMLTKKH